VSIGVSGNATVASQVEASLPMKDFYAQGFLDTGSNVSRCVL